MNREEQMKLIGKKCIEANPEIVELQFGCEVFVEQAVEAESGHYADAVGVVVYHETGGRVAGGDDFTDDFTKIYFPDWGITQEYTGDDMEGNRVIGRSIRLGDGLLAIKSAWWKKESVDGLDRIQLRLIFLWNLRKDDLTVQSEETINFIAELLQQRSELVNGILELHLHVPSGDLIPASFEVVLRLVYETLRIVIKQFRSQ